MSVSDSIEYHHNLVEAILGEDSAKVQLYRTSARFRSAVATLAQMIPMMVDGFAVDAAEYDQQHADAVKAMMHGVLSDNAKRQLSAHVTRGFIDD